MSRLPDTVERMTPPSGSKRILPPCPPSTEVPPPNHSPSGSDLKQQIQRLEATPRAAEKGRDQGIIDTATLDKVKLQVECAQEALHQAQTQRSSHARRWRRLGGSNPGSAGRRRDLATDCTTTVATSERVAGSSQASGDAPKIANSLLLIQHPHANDSDVTTAELDGSARYEEEILARSKCERSAGTFHVEHV